MLPLLSLVVSALLTLCETFTDRDWNVQESSVVLSSFGFLWILGGCVAFVYVCVLSLMQYASKPCGVIKEKLKSVVKF
jgi:choline-glycine betaine transporter